MTSTRPYLIRALYEWIVDNDATPHLLVEAADERVDVPRQYVENGVIVLNVAPQAVRDLVLGNDCITFSARFAGTPHWISVPIEAVQAIYARENGQGIFLGDAGQPAASESAPAAETARSGDTDGGRRPAPHLTIVK